MKESFFSVGMIVSAMWLMYAIGYHSGQESTRQIAENIVLERCVSAQNNIDREGYDYPMPVQPTQPVPIDEN